MTKPPTIIGLTGSIGMGKSTVARQFAAQGCAVSDADAITHRIMQPGGAAFDEIAQIFPQAIKEGRIDRQALGKLVFGDAAALKKLEAIIHPRVRQAHAAAISRAGRLGIRAVVLEVPLLFETGLQEYCDCTVVVSAPKWLQRQRVLARPGMSEQKFQQILARQLADAAKRARADYVIPTGLGKAVSLRAVKGMLNPLHISFSPQGRGGRGSLNHR